LLNLARADGGHVQLQIREFYFNDLVTDCCRTLQSLAASRRIALECRAETDLPFSGDEELLRRLVINLLDNAIRYTPPGGTVKAEFSGDLSHDLSKDLSPGSEAERGRPYLRVHACVTGMGISLGFARLAFPV